MSDNVGHLVVTPVFHPFHGMQDPALYGFQTVCDMRDGSLQDHIRGILQEPVLEHTGQPVFLVSFFAEDVQIPQLFFTHHDLVSHHP